MPESLCAQLDYVCVTVTTAEGATNVEKTRSRCCLVSHGTAASFLASLFKRYNRRVFTANRSKRCCLVAMGECTTVLTTVLTILHRNGIIISIVSTKARSQALYLTSQMYFL